MVTREFETKYLDSLPLAEQALVEQMGIGAVPTNLAHIFPPSTNWGLKPEEENHRMVSIYSPFYLMVYGSLLLY